MRCERWRELHTRWAATWPSSRLLSRHLPPSPAISLHLPMCMQVGCHVALKSSPLSSANRDSAVALLEDGHVHTLFCTTLEASELLQSVVVPHTVLPP